MAEEPSSQYGGGERSKGGGWELRCPQKAHQTAAIVFVGRQPRSLLPSPPPAALRYIAPLYTTLLYVQTFCPFHSLVYMLAGSLLRLLVSFHSPTSCFWFFIVFVLTEYQRDRLHFLFVFSYICLSLLAHPVGSDPTTEDRSSGLAKVPPLI